ncbi:MAG: BolA family protein [Legionella sp.]|uniref:BolA family protein n=1 Tax=Legionella sp. TaxID=459 RepID=UPI0039E66673
MSRKERIKQVLEKELSPIHLSVDDESANHHVPEGAETHFKVIAVSPLFAHVNSIERHRMLHRLLSYEFDQGLHALSMHLYTPEEWAKNQKILKSPACRDGYKDS